MKKNAFYAQSGGVTAVINASACGVIETARRHRSLIGKVYAGRNGILGALHEDMLDTSAESAAAIAALRHTPGGAFGSARYKLKGIDQNQAEYQRLIEVFRAHNIGYFFYNGGGDSMDTANKVAIMGKRMQYPVQCIGIPKTVDNDLPYTDTCPGFGSAAKYVAVSTLEAALDVESMARTSTKVFVLEVMGRHAGWIAAAGGLAGTSPSAAPHIILFPEITFDEQAFLERVKACVADYDYCVVVVSEGTKRPDGQFLADAGSQDAFGHTQLGGAAAAIADLVRDRLGLKFHYAIADYLQRSARHIAAKTDVEQAYAVGRKAVEFALKGESGIMPAIVRLSDKPYRWSIEAVKLSKVANRERLMPRKFISKDGFGITASCRRYLEPLIRGEDYPPYRHGMPAYAKLKQQPVPRLLAADFVLE
jgi:6-phosphofructokinase 1